MDHRPNVTIISERNHRRKSLWLVKTVIFLVTSVVFSFNFHKHKLIVQSAFIVIFTTGI
jgi:hypothetical protein